MINIVRAGGVVTRKRTKRVTLVVVDDSVYNSKSTALF